MAQDQNLKGVAALLRKLNALGAMDDGKVLRAATRGGMKPVLERARQLAPRGTHPHELWYSHRPIGIHVDEGFLKAHIRLNSRLMPDKTTAIATVGPSKLAWYGGFVETGTRKNAAHPWLRPAFYGSQNAIKQAMVEKFQDFVRQVIRTEST